MPFSVAMCVRACVWLYVRLDPPWLRPSCRPTGAHWYPLLGKTLFPGLLGTVLGWRCTAAGARPPIRRWCARANITAFLREAAFFLQEALMSAIPQPRQTGLYRLLPSSPARLHGGGGVLMRRVLIFVRQTTFFSPRDIRSILLAAFSLCNRCLLQHMPSSLPLLHFAVVVPICFARSASSWMFCSYNFHYGFGFDSIPSGSLRFVFCFVLHMYR